MVKQSQTMEVQSDGKSQHKAEPRIAETACGEIELAILSGGLFDIAQESHVNDRNWQIAQRRSLFSRIGRLHGNQHLQRLLIATNEVEKDQSGDAAWTDDELYNLEKQDELDTVAQRQEDPNAPANLPTLQLTPDNITVGMGEHVSVEAVFSGVNNSSDTGATNLITSGKIYSATGNVSAEEIYQNGNFTFYAAESGSFSISFDSHGQTITSNPVLVTTRDPKMSVSPPTGTAIAKGGKASFAVQIDGIYDQQALGAITVLSSPGITFESLPDIRSLIPLGTISATVDNSTSFRLKFMYFDKEFESNDVSVDALPPYINLGVSTARYKLGETVPIDVTIGNIVDASKLKGPMFTETVGLQILETPQPEYLVPNGQVNVRITQVKPVVLRLAFDYLGEQIESNALELTVEQPVITLSPLGIKVGIRQKFPVQYVYKGFNEMEDVGEPTLDTQGPVKVIEPPVKPTLGEQGEMVLEAEGTPGNGELILKVSYGKGNVCESFPLKFMVTPGPVMASSPDRVFFDTDKDAIRPDAAAGLNQVANRLAQDKSLSVTSLMGHADTRYTDEYNLGLSLRRAQSVYNYLMGLVIPGYDLAQVKDAVVAGFGEQAPVVLPETSEAEFQMNRRVEIFLGQGANQAALTPVLRLNPDHVQVGIGQQFPILFDVANIHEPDQMKGSKLEIAQEPVPLTPMQQEGGDLPFLPGGEAGTITMKAGDEPGNGVLKLGLTYGEETYWSNEVTVTTIDASLKASLEAKPEVFTGDEFQIHYILDGMPDPLAFEGLEVIQEGGVGGADMASVTSGLPASLTGERTEATLRMKADLPGDLTVRLRAKYSGRTFLSQDMKLTIIGEFTEFNIAMISGIEGGEVVGGCFYVFSFEEVGPGGRSGKATFVGGGVTAGTPVSVYGPSASTTIITPVPMRGEDFNGGGSITATGWYGIGPAPVGYGWSYLMFFTSKGLVQVGGFGGGTGYGAGGSIYGGAWSISM